MRTAMQELILSLENQGYQFSIALIEKYVELEKNQILDAWHDGNWNTSGLDDKIAMNKYYEENYE